jgi:hypothetical protein
MRLEYVLAYPKRYYRENMTISNMPLNTPGIHFYPLRCFNDDCDFAKETHFTGDTPIRTALVSVPCAWQSTFESSDEHCHDTIKKAKRKDMESRWFYEQGGGDLLLPNRVDD